MKTQTLEALWVHRQRLELAHVAAGIGVWDWDVKANETRCSRQYGPLYGLSFGDFAPSPKVRLELIHPRTV